MVSIDGADVVVIGGGVTGLSTARWLAKEGVDVIVIEKGVVGAEASGRNGGMGGYRINERASFALSALSMELWPVMDEELGYPTEYTPGLINIALTQGDVDSLELQRQRLARMGVTIDMLDSRQVEEMVPLVTPHNFGGAWRSDHVQANPQRTVQAYAWALIDLGGRIYQDTQVTDVKVIHGRITSVETSRGAIEGDFFVSACGPQTGLVAALADVRIPVAAGRVEIVITEPIPPLLHRGIFGNGLYGRQTLRGNLAYGGGPHEWVAVDLDTPEKPNTPVIRNIARRLNELFAGAGELRVIRSWACVVEQAPDMSPIIDMPAVPNNMVIATMSADGFCLSPASGKVISELVLHGETSVPIEGLQASRFRDVDPEWYLDPVWSVGSTSARQARTDRL